MKLYFSLIALFILGSFTNPAQQDNYSIVGSWKLVDMQLDGAAPSPARDNMKKTLGESSTRFVFDDSGRFRMVLGPGGRGLHGGYHYNPENHILSIKYGAYTDTAIVSWEGADRMIHETKDGKTRTTMQRVKE